MKNTTTTAAAQLKTLRAAAERVGTWGYVKVTLPDGCLARASAHDIMASQGLQDVRIRQEGRGNEFFFASQLTVAG